MAGMAMAYKILIPWKSDETLRIRNTENEKYYFLNGRECHEDL